MAVGTFDNPGPATIDEVPLQPLLNELVEEIGLQKEIINDEYNLYVGTPTLKQTHQIVTVGMEFLPDGQGGGVPGLQHLPSYTISLTPSDRLVLASGIKQRAFEEGLESNDIQRNVREALQAYSRARRKCVTQSKLALGGWYNATMTPPPFDGITFASSHSHYKAYNASSIPTQNMLVDCALLITEHGYNASNIFAELNQYDMARLVKQGELMQDASDFSIASPILQKMQAAGMTSQYTLGGVPLVVNNYMPNGYMWVGSLERPPMRATRPYKDDGSLNSYMGTIIPNSDMRWVSEWSCWAVIPDVVELGEGVAVWLADVGNSGVYTAPSSLINLV